MSERTFRKTIKLVGSKVTKPKLNLKINMGNSDFIFPSLPYII